MEKDNSKMAGLTCENDYYPNRRCTEIWAMTIEKAHQILEKAGFDAVARDCMEKRKQLFDIALFVEKQGFGFFSKYQLNALAKENQLMGFVTPMGNPVLFTGRHHQILEEIGFSEEAIKCLGNRGEVSNIVEIVERHKMHLTGSKAVLNKLANKLAVENRIEELIAVAENNVGLAELDIATIENFMQSTKLTSEAIDKLVEVGKAYQIITAYRVTPESTVAAIYKEYLSDLRTFKKNSRVRKRRKRKKIGRTVRCKGRLSALSNLALKGKYIGEFLSQCEYLLTHAQLVPLFKKFNLNAKDIAELCNLGVIYRKEQDETFLYGESEIQFKQKWGSQVEYFNELFNRSGLTKTKRLINSLVKSALSEKDWHLDEIYVSILIRTVLQCPASINEKTTEEKTKK